MPEFEDADGTARWEAQKEVMTFSELVSLLLGVESDHVFTDTRTCRCGYKPEDQRDWRYHVAGNQAEAVLTALGG